MVISFFKQDIKDSSRVFLPIIGVIAALYGLLLLLPMFIGNSSSMTFFFASLFSMLISVLYISLIVLSIRGSIYVLYTSLYKDQSFRSFTTPISSLELIVVKIMTLFFWSLVIVLSFVGLSLISFLFKGNPVAQSVTEIVIAFREIFGLVGNLGLFNAFTIVALFLASSLNSTFTIMLAGAVANTSWFPKSRGLVAFGTWVLIGFIQMMIVSQFSVNLDVNILSLNLAPLWILIIGLLLFSTLSTWLITWLWDNKLEIV